MKIKAGKSYKINHPKGQFNKPTKVHIEYILDDPTLIDQKDDPDYPDHMLVVYRVWGKNKGRFYRYVVSYWELAFWNDWENSVMGQKKKK